MTKKLILIPTYNERENIESLILEIFSLKEGGYHILIIDDASPDGTADIVKKLQQSYGDKLFLIERKGKLGLGTAYLCGFKWSLEHGYDYTFEMDADFSHDPKDLDKLFAACSKGAELAIGSRYCDGVSVVNWPIGRIIMSYFASMYVRKILRMKIFDCTAGFKCYSNKLLKAINLNGIQMKGYGFQIEMKYTAYKLGFKIVEVPIIFKNRKKGNSKMSSGIFGEAFWGVIKLRFKGIK